jgi:hypothetical protein
VTPVQSFITFILQLTKDHHHHHHQAEMFTLHHLPHGHSIALHAKYDEVNMFFFVEAAEQQYFWCA